MPARNDDGSFGIAAALPVAAAFLILVGCGAALPAGTPQVIHPAVAASAALRPTPTPSVPFPDQEERRHFFDDLVAFVREHHVFSEAIAKQLGRTWDSDLAEVKPELLQATSKRALVDALVHFGNTLHNPHCGFSTPAKRPRKSLDTDIDVEWSSGHPVFYVVRPASGTPMLPGDVLVAKDGVPAQELLAREALVSNATSWFGIAQTVAASFTNTARSSVHVGDNAHFSFRHRAGTDSFPVVLAWRDAPPQEDEDLSELAIDYQRQACASLPDPHYGPYLLTGEGQNFCLYTSMTPRYREYPILRYFSFQYVQEGEPQLASAYHRVRAEWASLRSQLAPHRADRALIIDLRDNHGGNNPNWVMDWFAPAPYVDQYVFTRLDEALRDPELRSKVQFQDDPAAYIRELDARVPGQLFTKKCPFFCPPSGCDWDNRYTPEHRVTELPLALLVGPDCVSSCDAFTQQFDEFDFAPLIGEPTAAGHTTRRLRHEVRLPGTNELLGVLSTAFSYEVSGKSGAPVEGVPIRLDDRVERTFGNRDQYGAVLVDHAIAAVSAFHYPPRKP